jgi:hypothetical protein
MSIQDIPPELVNLYMFDAQKEWENAWVHLPTYLHATSSIALPFLPEIKVQFEPPALEATSSKGSTLKPDVGCMLHHKVKSSEPHTFFYTQPGEIDGHVYHLCLTSGGIYFYVIPLTCEIEKGFSHNDVHVLVDHNGGQWRRQYKPDENLAECVHLLGREWWKLSPLFKTVPVGYPTKFIPTSKDIYDALS